MNTTKTNNTNNNNKYKFTFSYRSYWDEEGIHYSQTITAYIPRNVFIALNYKIATTKLHEQDKKNDGKSYDFATIYHLDTFKLNTKNFTKLTQRDFFLNYFNLNNDKRLKHGRNTIIIFKPIDKSIHD